MAKASYVAGFLLAALFFIGGIQLCASTNSTSASCIQPDRNALLMFKASLQDPSNLLSSWEGQDCCHWKGVTCDRNTGHVIELHLSNTSDGLLGLRKVNISLMELKHLRYLDLSGNYFQQSEIPKFFGSLNKLRYLNLSCTHFIGKVPHQLGNLTNLQVLDLRSDYFQQAYADNFQWASSLLSLQHLDMSGVDLGSAHNLMEVLTRLPSLQNLQLSGCGIKNTHFQHALLNSTFIASIQFLDLSSNALQTPILRALQNMSFLRVLDISRNSFNSSVPLWLGNLKSLVTLNLRWNEFDSIEGGLSSLINNYCHLKSLDLSQNRIHGEAFGSGQNLSRCVMHSLESLSLGSNEIGGQFPNWLGQLRGLQRLDLFYNSLHGPIPSSVWNLSNLRVFNLSYNQLSGVIPKSLGQLVNLEAFRVSSNSLEGTLSEIHFSNLSRLKWLEIGYNYNLTFKVSSDWIPPFSLQQINMENCKIEGSEFPQWLRTQEEVTELYLGNASISGIFPLWLQSMPLSVLDLSLNRISGPLPSNFGDDMAKLFLSDNRINGSIPNSLCRLNYLQALDLSRNKLHGQIPDCWADSLNAGQIEYIDLSSNKLSGTIPASIGNLPSLQQFHVNNNSLSGKLPLALIKCSGMFSMDVGQNKLSGTIPTWIGENFLDLEILRLRENMFTGTIPLSLCGLSHLRILDLGYNSLVGRIPLCFSNLGGMIEIYSSYSEYSYNEKVMQVMKGQFLEYTRSVLRLVANMDLSSNKLVGHIPDELTTLVGLLGLNLSHNNLSGSIPPNIGNIASLESLDLSDNQLSGTIPNSMSIITSLSYLNLSHNKLSGKIPKGNQLQTLTDPSIYAGNLKLCGDPLPDKCPGDGEQVQPPMSIGLENEEHGEGKSEKFWFFFVVSCGYATGLWGVFGILIVKKNWRIAYFRYADKAKEWVLAMVAVQSLSLGSNEIGGQLPNWLGQLRGLQHLDLSFNSLHGPVPSSVWNLSNLRVFDLSHNQLSGVIPKSLGQPVNLEVFSVYTNSLEGTLSEIHFSNLSRLKRLEIGYNYNLTFKVNSDWMPPFSLQIILMENCKIEGSEFPQWLRTQEEVTVLYLRNASISGIFPMWLQSMPLSYLDLSLNQISGPLPSNFGADMPLSSLDLSSNQISGPLPSNFGDDMPLTYLDLSLNQISGPLPSNFGDDMPLLVYLFLSNNRINGSIPNSLCRLNDLRLLDLSRNMLHGQIPHCWTNSLRIEYIDLSSNKLSGTIPASICNLPSLMHFHLNNNSVSGKLPLALINCSGILSMDLGQNKLSGTIPTWIGENFLDLGILRLRENMFTGTIPLSLCRLSQLQILDLGNNSLVGRIPLCFSNLSGMIEISVMKGQFLEYRGSVLPLVANIDLSSNKLVGHIPYELTTLVGLLGLNLSHNNLSGSIPRNIGNIKSLESLDLLDNQLSGTIPNSMSIITSLSYLNLSHNKLSGKIPKGNQLQTLTDPSIYAGNKLCGDPLPDKCPGDEEPVQPPIGIGPESEEHGEGKSEKFWFFFVVSCGYVTGFWGVFGILIVKKNWRIAYFRYADKAKDWVLVMVAVQVARLKRKMERNNNGTE
ncbi:hypothetical protein UlMin_004539 [Ulmus minor]